jgi:hypothetical protein
VFKNTNKKTREEREADLKKFDEFRKRLNDLSDIRERARNAPDFSKDPSEPFADDSKKKVARSSDPDAIP